MSNTAGRRTRRRGWSRIGRALATPPVPFIIIGVIAGEFAITVGEAAAARAIGLHTDSTATAFLLGVILANTTTILVLSGFVAVMAGGVNWLTGGLAERWTGHVLSSLGPTWTIVHSLVFQTGGGDGGSEVDVDHVAAGPRGVLVFESKYTSVPTDLDAAVLPARIRDDAAQASRNAVRVKRLLLGQGVTCEVHSVLIYWGRGVSLPKQPVRTLGRVKLVAGADAKRWTGDLGSNVDEGTAEAGRRALLQASQG